ncbi:MAG: hypothetical protein J5504_06705 [Butyrivibrio sp.]|nr:hypothetical protein [Butyrivibrio sp.]
MKKVIGLVMATVFATYMLTGCGNFAVKEENSAAEKSVAVTEASTEADEDDEAVEATSEAVENETDDAAEAQTQKVALDTNKRVEVESPYCPDEVIDFLNSLETDFTKVKWGVVYPVTGMEGVIISVTPYMKGTESHLIIGITNLYDQDLTIKSEGFAKDTSGKNTADIKFEDKGVGAGNTVIHDVACKDFPSGEISWTNIEIPDTSAEYVVWDGVWSFSKDMVFTYELTADKEMVPGEVTALLLDSEGYVLGSVTDNNTGSGRAASGSMKSDYDNSTNDLCNVAMFVNPTAAE